MTKREIIFALGAALLLAIVLAPFASPWPDGLEKIAEDKGFLEKSEGQSISIPLWQSREAGEPALSGPVADYLWPGIANEKLAVGVAGGMGTLVVFLSGYGLARLLKRRNNK